MVPKAAEQRPELSAGRVCEPWVTVRLIRRSRGAATQFTPRIFKSKLPMRGWLERLGSVKWFSFAAPRLRYSVVTRARRLALGLVLTAAPQLAERIHRLQTDYPAVQLD